MRVSPNPGAVTVTFNYAWLDAANQIDPTPALVTMPFSSIFPIELISFTAQNIDNQMARVLWTTKTETNNDYFELLRSSNGIDYQVITRVKGAGNSTTQKDYKYLDLKPIIGINYYQLKQVDFDGTISLSKVEVVEFKGVDKIINWTSSNSSQLIVNINPSKSNILISLYDLSGKLINVQQSMGVNEYYLDANRLESAIYIIKATDSKGYSESIRVSYTK